MSIYPQVLGVYSEKKDDELGTGSTRLVRRRVIYWFARRLNDDTYEVQPLNVQNLPSGLKKTVSKGQFVSSFIPEPKYYEQHTAPMLKSLKAKLDKGEALLSEGNLVKAEQEFVKALLMDEVNPKACLGLGTVYCEKNEVKKLKGILDVLLGNNEVFQEEQRHQFNTFGMSLRKAGHVDEALGYYQAALAYSPNDENLHFNLARVHYDKNDYDSCLSHLEQALDLNPNLEEAVKFLDFVRNKKAKKENFTPFPEIVIPLPSKDA